MMVSIIVCAASAMAVADPCDAKDGWYDTAFSRLVVDGECMQKVQVMRQYRDYQSMSSFCVYRITDITWIDTSDSVPAADGTSCNDSLWCTVDDSCSGGVCLGFQRDCSGNSFGELSSCDNVPDANPFTFDYSVGFDSVCSEALQACTQEDRVFTHECSIAGCNASCEQDSDCDDNNAATADTCLANCSCQYTVIESCGDGVCGSSESCSTCPADCGSCQTTTTKKSSGGGGGSISASDYLPSIWNCTDWSECVDGNEKRTCELNGVSKEESRVCFEENQGSSDGGSSGTVVSEDSSSAGVLSGSEPLLMNDTDSQQVDNSITGFSIKDFDAGNSNSLWFVVLMLGVIAGYIGLSILRKE